MKAMLMLLATLLATDAAIGAEVPLNELTTEQQALHLLNRLSYGPRPGDLDHVMSVGVDRYLDEQLHPERLQIPASLTAELSGLSTYSMSYGELFNRFGPLAKKEAGDSPEERKKFARSERAVVLQAQQARLAQAIESPNQLQEMMVEFWFNHFNVFAEKGLDRIWIGAYERNAIRPYVFGQFRNLLGATAKSPAMLFYLDNWQSAKTGTDRKGREQGLNENYARELMELHTLGVNGGYSQKDVTELARILTGWTFNPRALKNDSAEPFQFARARHDEGEKIFLGQHFFNEGQDEGERALDIMAEHPSTARHVSYELAQYFVADVPPPMLVEHLSQRFQQTHGDIRQVLLTLFRSPEFWDAANVGNKYKTPYQYVLSAMRVADIHPVNYRPALEAIRQLGMKLYGCLTPDGYKNTEAAWLSPGAMIDRLNFATALGSGRLRWNRVLADAEDVEASDKLKSRMNGVDSELLSPPDAIAMQAALGARFSKQTLETIARSPLGLRASLILGSPEFMRH